MAISIEWDTRIITVPKSFMTEISPTLYELDVNVFRLALRDLEDDPEGLPYPDTHVHNTEVTLSGVTYARQVILINGYSVTFEDGMYAVRCVGANHNLADVKNLNMVSLIIGNSAGLVVTGGGGGGGGATAAEIWTYGARTLTVAYPTTSAIASAVRSELTTELTHVMTLQNGQGLDSTQATMLLEIYRLYGLDPTLPLVVTETERTVGGTVIEQTISSTGSSTTVTRV